MTGTADAVAQAATTRVAAEDVVKLFGGVQALRGVSVAVERGTIHGLVGENGAGKSTLGRILAGVLQPDAGQVYIDGEPVSLHTPRDAIRLGVAMVAQELMVVPQLSVIENVFLGGEEGRGPGIDRSAMRRRFEELIEVSGLVLPAEVPAGSLRVAEQQKVEILRAIARDASTIIMDEPTAALSAREARQFFEIVGQLRADGKTIIYVSHFLQDILRIADTVTVLKDGEVVRTARCSEETPDTLVHAMLGRPLDRAFPPKPAPRPDAPIVLQVEGAGRDGIFDDVALTVRVGEIVGLAGLVGSGRTEVARAIAGVDRLDRGVMTVDGEPFAPRDPRSAIERGVALLPESRKEQGLLMQQSVADNIALPHLDEFERHGLLSKRRWSARVREVMHDLDIRAPHGGVTVNLLSGGNQQKVLFGRWVMERPRLLIADEPTRGVDIGAKRAIYDLLTRLAEQQMAILLISSELEEVMGLATRVIVMRNGRFVEELEGNEIEEGRVMRAAFGTEARTQP